MVRWLQSLKDFSCGVDADDPGRMSHLAAPCPKEANRLYCGTSRSSVCGAVPELDQVEDLGSFSSGQNRREGVASEEGEERLGGVGSQI